MKYFVMATVFLGLSSCAADKIDASQFDSSCQKNSDCVGVLTGETACCPIDQSAINASELGAYSDALNAVDCSDSEDECALVANKRPTCEDSVCAPSSESCEIGEECRGVDP